MSFTKPPKPPAKPRLLTMRTPAKLPRGPKLYRPAGDKPVGGPGPAPPGFVGARTSATEWLAYWALAKIFKNPIDPRVGPFLGAWPEWVYQKGVELGPQKPANVDFVVYHHGRGGKPIGLRIQTEYFHLFTDNATQVYDALRREDLQEHLDIIDVFDYDLLRDPTGQAAIVVIKNALGMLERANPLLSGVAIRGSRLT